MNSQYLNTDMLNKQELQVTLQTQEVFGWGRYGFCDYSLDGIYLLLQGIHYFRNKDDSLNEMGEYKSCEYALRTIVYYDLYHTSLTYKAIYNLVHQGYYKESAILLRSIVESLVKMKYLHRQKNIDLINSAFAGHYEYRGAKFKVKNKTMFDALTPGLYDSYRLLCDMAHGAFAAHALKISMQDFEHKKIILDDGLVFREDGSTFVINQFTVYLFAHIKFMFLIFPEIEKNMTKTYAKKYIKFASIFEKIATEFAQKEQNKKWYNVVRQLWD